jgi:hypothetical protein
VTGFSVKIVALMIVTQPVVYVTTLAVTERGKIQVSGVKPPTEVFQPQYLFQIHSVPDF